MGISKSYIFSSEQNEIALFAKALGHPARIAILQYLAGIDSCVCGDIVGEIGLAQSTISQHLKALKAAGIIQGEIDGTRVCYCLNKDKIQHLKSQFDFFLGALETNNSCC